MATFFIGTSVHEFGHAIGAKLASYEDIIVTVGTGTEWLSFQFFGIQWKIHTFFFLGGYISYETAKKYEPLDIAFIAMMGPFANGILALSFDFLLHVHVHNGLYIFFLFNAWLILSNIIPMKWNEKESDGYIMLKMIGKHVRVHSKR